MNRSLYTLAIAALFALGLAQTASAQFGVAVGANFDKVTDISGDREATFNNASGYHIGVFVDLPVGPIAIRPGVFYTDVGSLEAESGNANTVRQNFDVSLIEIPIDVRYRLMTPLASPYLSAGPVLRFANQSNDEFQVKNFSMAGNVGAGVELSLMGFRPFIEGRYQFGVSRFVDEFEVGGVTFRSDDDTKLNSFMIRVGTTF